MQPNDYYASLCESSSEESFGADSSAAAVRVIGASIIPIMHDPIFGRPYTVLGRERRNPHWPDDDDAWCDFGGSVNWHDSKCEDACECAAREAWEETCALLRFAPHDELPLQSPLALTAQLRAGGYLVRYVFAHGRFEYHTFVVAVPWDPSFPKRFQQTAHALRSRASSNNAPFLRALHVLKHPAVVARGCGSMHVEAAFMEKTAVHLFSTPELQRSLSEEVHRRMLRRYIMRQSFRARLRRYLNILDDTNAPQPPSQLAAAPTWNLRAVRLKARGRSRSL